MSEVPDQRKSSMQPLKRGFLDTPNWPAPSMTEEMPRQEEVGLSEAARERLRERQVLLGPVPHEWRGNEQPISLSSDRLDPDTKRELLSQLHYGIVLGTWPTENDIQEGEGFIADQSGNMGRAYAISLKEPVIIDGVTYRELLVKGGGAGLPGLLGRYGDGKYGSRVLTEDFIAEEPIAAMDMVRGFITGEIINSRYPIGLSGEGLGYVESVVAGELQRVGARVELPLQMMPLDRESMLMWAVDNPQIPYPLEYVLNRMGENPSLFVRLVTDSGRLHDIISHFQQSRGDRYVDQADTQGKYSRNELIQRGVMSLQEEIAVNRDGFGKRYGLSSEEVNVFAQELQSSNPSEVTEAYIRLISYFQGWNQGIRRVVSHVRFGNYLYPPHHRPGDISITGASTDFEEYLSGVGRQDRGSYESVELGDFKYDTLRPLLASFGLAGKEDDFLSVAETASKRGIQHAVAYYKQESRQNKDGTLVSGRDLYDRVQKLKSSKEQEVNQEIALDESNQKVFDMVTAIGPKNDTYKEFVKKALLARQMSGDRKHLHPAIFPSWLRSIAFQYRDTKVYMQNLSDTKFSFERDNDNYYLTPNILGQKMVTISRNLPDPTDISSGDFTQSVYGSTTVRAKGFEYVLEYII